MKKLILTSIVSLFILSCSFPVPDNSSFSPVTRHPSLNFTDLEKEYKSFSTKALSDAYVSRMFNKFLITSPNPTQVIRQLEFARYMKDIKSDPGYFNSLKTFINGDISKFNLINNTNGVTAKKLAESATFGTFVDSLNPAFVTDAQSFIDAAGISDTNQQNAIKTLVSDLKTTGIWTKMKAIYPFVGATASSHKFNLKDPRDLDAAFRLQFNGGWTHLATGSKPNGTDGSADTFLIPSSVLSQNSVHLSFYSRTNSPSRGCTDIGSKGIGNWTVLEIWGNSLYPIINTSNLISFSHTSSLGMYLSSRINPNQVVTYKNGSVLNTSSNTSTGLSTNKLSIGACHMCDDINYQYFSDREYSFATIGDGLSETDAANLYTIIQVYETTLGRQVN